MRITFTDEHKAAVFSTLAFIASTRPRDEYRKLMKLAEQFHARRAYADLNPEERAVLKYLNQHLTLIEDRIPENKQELKESLAKVVDTIEGAERIETN